jgi:hypothetical protein
MKICPVGGELFHVDGGINRETDRRTDMTKLPEILLTRLKAMKKVLGHHEGTRNFSY